MIRDFYQETTRKCLDRVLLTLCSRFDASFIHHVRKRASSLYNESEWIRAKWSAGHRSGNRLSLVLLLAATYVSNFLNVQSVSISFPVIGISFFERVNELAARPKGDFVQSLENDSV